MPIASGPLQGIRVLDLADESGVYCGKLLADMGADVVKIEPPSGDRARSIGPFYTGAPHAENGTPNDRSLFFWHYNTNKRSVVLDLSDTVDRERFAQLAATADLIIETFRPAHLDRLGLSYARLHDSNLALSMVSITPFGQSGPYRDWRSSDTVAQAVGGMLFVNGHPDEPPLRALGLQAYQSASTYGAIGGLLALLARDRIGGGQHIDVSIQECVASTVEHVSGYFHQTGQIEVRRGTLHWSRYFRVAKCRDGYAMHCTLGDWTSLIEWVKADGKAQELAGEEWDRFQHRREHCVRLFDVLDEWAKEYPVDELVEGAQLRRLPYAAVVAPETLPQQPQLVGRGFFVPVEHPELQTTVTYPGAPYVFSDSKWAIHRPPPRLGEHSLEVFEETRSPHPRLDTGPGSSPGPAVRRHDGPSGGISGAAHPNAKGVERRRALDGVRVLDFTWVVAGPVATRILADHGAEVIKIERRDSLDFGSRRGGLTGNLNRGKRSVVLNMADPRGVDLAKRLVATADVVIDNFSARVMQNWALDYESLRAIKPDIIAMSMSGFGHTGPQRDYVSYGPTLQALSGYTLLMRHLGGEPAGWGFSYSDMAGGYSGALAVLLALWHRKQTGRGQFIDLSQFESVTALLGPLLLDVLANGAAIAASGNRSQERPGAPHGVYRCRDDDRTAAVDRWCAITVFDDKDWSRFRDAIGAPAWTRDPRFTRLADRIAHQDEIDNRVTEWTRDRAAEDVAQTLQHAGVAAGVVNTAHDLCRLDPQLQARGYWAQVETSEGEHVEFDGVPIRLAATPGRVEQPGPLLGEHTDSVLRDLLCVSSVELAALRADRVIG